MRQYRHLWHQDALDWPIALQREGKRQQGWWQFYSWFAQIPEQTFIVKRRRYLDWLLALMTAKATPLQRLWLTRWVRSQELFGLYWRITLLVAFLVWLTRLADWWWTPVIGSGGVYLLVVQLIPLYQQTHQILWTRLLPVQQVQRQFQQLLILGLIGPIVLVMLFGHFTWLGTLVLWIVAIGLVFGYVPRLIRR
jgi:ABC-2 type transport system permease protein